MARTVGAEEQRCRVARQLAEKEGERERIMTLFRRNRISIDEAEAQLDAIAGETAQLQAMMQALRAQDDLTRASESHLASAAALLAMLQDRLDEIEQTGDRRTMQQVVEQLVTGLTVRTEGKGRDKQAWVKIQYAFSGQAQYVVSGTARPTSRCTAPTRRR